MRHRQFDAIARGSKLGLADGDGHAAGAARDGGGGPVTRPEPLGDRDVLGGGVDVAGGGLDGAVGTDDVGVWRALRARDLPNFEPFPTGRRASVTAAR